MHANFSIIKISAFAKQIKKALTFVQIEIALTLILQLIKSIRKKQIYKRALSSLLLH